MKVDLDFATTQLNSTQSWVGLIFLRNHKPQTTNHNRTEPSVTFSQLLHNQTRPNSVCNLISTQLEDSCKKNGRRPKKFQNGRRPQKFQNGRRPEKFQNGRRPQKFQNGRRPLKCQNGTRFKMENDKKNRMEDDQEQSKMENKTKNRVTQCN